MRGPDRWAFESGPGAPPAALPWAPSRRSTGRPHPPDPSQGPLPKLALKDIASKKAVGMVAGGTGLTPMLQVIDEALRQGLPTEFTFIFANVSEDDIIMKKHLDDLAAKHKNFTVHYGACCVEMCVCVCVGGGGVGWLLFARWA